MLGDVMDGERVQQSVKTSVPWCLEQIASSEFKTIGAAQNSSLAIFCLLEPSPTLIQSKKIPLVSYSFPTTRASFAGAVLAVLQSLVILQQFMIFCDDLLTKNTSESVVAGPGLVIYSGKGIYLH